MAGSAVSRLFTSVHVQIPEVKQQRAEMADARPLSFIKTHYDRLPDGSYKCKKCPKVYKKSSGGENLKNHVERNHLVMQARPIHEFMNLSSTAMPDLIVDFVVNGLHPFTIVEEPSFVR